MSTVNFKSNCNNRSLAITLQRTIHLYHGLNPAASDRQLILHDLVTGLRAVIECGPRLTGKNLYSMCILQEAVKRTRGATWYSSSLGHVAHTHITGGTLINRIHYIRYVLRINHLTSMFHVRNSFNARYWKSEEEALDLTVRRTRCGRRRGPLSPTTDCMSILQQLTLRSVNGLAPCCANPVSQASKRSCRSVTALHSDSKHAACQKTHSCLHDDPPQAQVTQNTLETRHKESLYTVRTNDGISSVFCELPIVFCVQ